MKFCYSLHLSSPDSRDDLWQEILAATFEPTPERGEYAAHKEGVFIRFFEADTFIKEEVEASTGVKVSQSIYIRDQGTDEAAGIILADLILALVKPSRDMVMLYEGESVFLLHKSGQLTLTLGEDHVFARIASKHPHQRADISRMYLDYQVAVDKGR